MIDYTIAICTRNRAPILRLALESIVEHAPGGQPPPVIVVDNASTDDTAAVAASFVGRLPISVYTEEQLGSSYARNRALAHCSTVYIVFLDDDARVTPEWFAGLEAGMRDHAMPDYFGGPYGPYYLKPKPAWFKDRYGSDHLQQPEGPVRPGDHLSGGNMGWRADFLRELGGFPTDMGPKGDRMSFGEDTAVVHRAMIEHPQRRGVFLPAMRMEHLVPDYKMRLRYWVGRFWQLGRDDSRSFPGRYPLDLRTFAYEIALLGFLPIYYLFRPRDRYPYWQNLFFEVGLWRIRFWGRVYTRLFGR